MSSPDQDRSGILRVFTSRRETRAFYDKISDFYDLLSERSEGPVRRAGIEMLAPRNGERILEIGCGTGHSVVDLAAAVGPEGRVLAIDLSEGMLARSAARVVEANLSDRVRFACADAVQLPLAASTVDAVFMSFTLELFDTPEIPRVLEECKRVLTLAGRIGVVGMSKEGPGGVILEAYEWSHRHFPNFVDCRPIFVSRALETAGFRVVEKKIAEMWVPVEIVVGLPDEQRSLALAARLATDHPERGNSAPHLHFPLFPSSNTAFRKNCSVVHSGPAPPR
ncbi:MAG: methyltransferase domain-containing protein [Acidobacteriia bacterium]|nr:methyltransferase domain-containing protein [Terriglobia bacterium]